MTQDNSKTRLASRRQKVFGAAVLSVGVAMVSFLTTPAFVGSGSDPHFFFHTVAQEKFFFDVFGFIGACWLLTWIAALNGWNAASKIGQWLGLIFLCIEQVNLILIWRLSADPSQPIHPWLAPCLLQLYIFGCFFGFFTLPGLTRDGNKTLTGLGTLLVLLPWLIGRPEIEKGARVLHGLFS